MAVLKRERKRRQQSVDVYRENGRDDLADAEQAEADLIATFLPKELSEDELAHARRSGHRRHRATSKKDMGTVMKAVLAAAAVAPPTTAGRLRLVARKLS